MILWLWSQIQTAAYLAVSAGSGAARGATKALRSLYTLLVAWGWMILVASLILWFAYIKLRYPFWNSQPVFHSYDLWRYAYTEAFPIQRRGPTKNKYHCPEHVRTWSYADLPEDLREQWVHFIQAHVPRGAAAADADDAFATVTVDTLHSLLSGTSAPSWVSLFQERSIQVVDADGSGESSAITVTRQPIEAGVVSRPIQIRSICLAAVSQQQPTQRGLAGSYHAPITAYYLDYLGGVTPARIRQIIQTHIFHQRVRNPDVNLTVLCVQGTPCAGVVPWLQYTSWGMDLTAIPAVARRRTKKGSDSWNHDDPHYRCVRMLSGGDLIEMTDVFMAAPVFDAVLLPDPGQWSNPGCVAYPGVTAVTAAKGTDAPPPTYYVFALKFQATVVAYYIFKDLRIFCETAESATLAAVASLCLMDPKHSLTEERFGRGWLDALTQIRQLYPQYRHMGIEGTSHNVDILRYLTTTRALPIIYTPTPHYLYLHNYVHPSMTSMGSTPSRWAIIR